MLTAVIPVRSGSTRCKRKNMRPFANSSLLALKIKQLKQVRGIDRILVSSDCTEMLALAEKLGADTHHRPAEFATTECPGWQFFVHLAEQVHTEYMMYTHCVAPLVSQQSMQKLIDVFYSGLPDQYDSIATANVLREFLWQEAGPMNFSHTHAPRSQDLEPIYVPNYGCCLRKTSDVISHKHVIGFKPMFIECSLAEFVDIDTPAEFLLAELMYTNQLPNDTTCENIMSRRQDKIVSLDCTIRDGGYRNNWHFTLEQVVAAFDAVSRSGMDYFELGFRCNKWPSDVGPWYYTTEELAHKVQAAVSNGAKLCVTAQHDKVTLSDFVPAANSALLMVRVQLSRSHTPLSESAVKTAQALCSGLIDMGYEVCLNVSCGHLITEEEANLVARHFAPLELFAVYFTDTFGSFTVENLPPQLYMFYRAWMAHGDQTTRFGFHGHNNMGNVEHKTRTAIFNGCSVVDSTIAGMGRGAGNLKSLQLMNILHPTDDTAYLNAVAPLVSYEVEHLSTEASVHPYYAIAARLSVHPDEVDRLAKLSTDAAIAWFRSNATPST